MWKRLSVQWSSSNILRCRFTRLSSTSTVCVEVTTRGKFKKLLLRDSRTVLIFVASLTLICTIILCSALRWPRLNSSSSIIRTEKPFSWTTRNTRRKKLTSFPGTSYLGLNRKVNSIVNFWEGFCQQPVRNVKVQIELTKEIFVALVKFFVELKDWERKDKESFLCKVLKSKNFKNTASWSMIAFPTQGRLN